MGFLGVVIRVLIFDVVFATLLGGGMRTSLGRTTIVLLLSMILPVFVIGHKVARYVLEPAPAYMRDDVATVPPIPVGTIVAMPRTPDRITCDPDTAWGFDAVATCGREGRR